MKEVGKTFCLFSCVLTCVLLISLVSVVFAQNGNNFMASAAGGSLWVLNKSTRRLMFVQFTGKDKIWKSLPINIPSNYNVEECRLQSFGRRGVGLLLFDISSGLATAYAVQRDHSIEKGIDLSFTPNDKKFSFAGRSDKFWILNCSSRELLLIEFTNIGKVKKSPPVLVPRSFNLTECQLEIVGKHGEAVFLFDRSSGKTTYYKRTVDEEGGLDGSCSIKEYLDVNLGNDLK